MNTNHISKGYDKIASKYAEAFIDELDEKPLDRYLLKEFSVLLRTNSKACDFGCGPGHISRFLKDLDIDVFGADISEGMINVATEINPDIKFIIDNMIDSKLVDESIGGAISFYSIVHLDYKQIEQVVKQMWRVLENEGVLFLAFHVGDSILHVEELFDEKVEFDYVFLNTETIVDLLKVRGFKIIEAITRYPYIDHEYESKRGYVICKKING
jgi:SAM-dependent methyltransferase